VSDLTVRAERLAPSFDLLAACAGEGSTSFLFERGGLGVASAPDGGGIAVRADLAVGRDGLRGLAVRALAELRAIGASTGGPPVTGVGAAPFAGIGEGYLAVPGRLVRRTERGATWLQEVEGTDGAFAPLRPAAGAPLEPFSPVQLAQLPDEEAYAAAVRDAVGRIHAGELRKVVLARTIEVAAGRRLDPVALTRRLRAVDADAYAFLAPLAWPAGAAADVPPVLAGASPELLVARRGLQVRSTPLAGSAPRGGTAAEDVASGEALRASGKNREEHAIVVEAIAEVLGRFCHDLAWDREPVLLATANLWHLATRFTGHLLDPGVTAMDLVAELHPTPAVCGTPRAEALRLIGELEPFARGHYAGPVGWMDATGDGEWAIALRCAELSDDTARLFAGAGIVGDSDPQGEVDETDRKFRAFLDSLRWG
jgi:isochorismate synthase